MVEFEWNLEKIIDGLLATSDYSYRKPAMSRRFCCTTEDKIDSVWHMEIKANESHVGIKLCFTDSASITDCFLNNFEISLKNENDLTWVSVKKRKVFDMENMPKYHIKSFICKKVLQYLKNQNHSLTVICKMNLQLIGCKINNSVPLSVPDFENLMYDTEFSDLVIVGPNKQYKVHKNILSARSKVFYSMIKEIKRENRESIIVIDDFDDDVIQELIRYIYCGKVKQLPKLSKSLLEAAEKFYIEGLKSICLEDFCKNITTKNACKLLLLLDQYKIDDLKSQVMDFIVHNLQHLRCEDFEAYNNPVLLKEIFFKTAAFYLENDK